MSLVVVGLGVMEVDQVTRETERALREVDEVLYVGTGVATEAWLSTLGPKVTDLFAACYAEGDQRLDIYERIAARTIAAAMERPVAFAMHGHPLLGAYAPFLILDLARVLGVPVRVLPGVSSLDAMMADLAFDPFAMGLQAYDCTDMLLRRRPLVADVPCVLWSVGVVETRLHTERRSRPERFHRLRDHLMGFYPPWHPVVAYYAPPHPLVPVDRFTFRLADLPLQADRLHHGHSLYLQPVAQRPVVDAELARAMDDPAHLAKITETPRGRAGG